MRRVLVTGADLLQRALTLNAALSAEHAAAEAIRGSLDTRGAERSFLTDASLLALVFGAEGVRGFSCHTLSQLQARAWMHKFVDPNISHADRLLKVERDVRVVVDKVLPGLRHVQRRRGRRRRRRRRRGG